MYSYHRFLIFLLILAFCAAPTFSLAQETPLVTDKVLNIMDRVKPEVNAELSAKGLKSGSHLFIRIFKLPGELQVWVEDDGQYRLFKSYPICNYSGYLGPKLKEGDWQSPEGFYKVTPGQMNPRSSYHLSFNIGYPNDYDKFLKRSGSSIMVHGNCSSKGCFAMNDYRMEEIYTLAHAAFMNGQLSIDVHIFPFHLTKENMYKYRFSPWIGFWKNLREGYDAFERSRQVPVITADQGKYIVSGTIKVAMSGKKK